ENDRLAIIEAIKDGTVDAIATDHAPHHRDEKNVEFQYASNGISGFETAYSAAYTYLVEPGHIKMDRLAELMSINPSRLLGKYSGGIKAGASADITIVDNSAKVIVNSDEFVSKGKNSPFSGKLLKGCIKFTIMDGIVRYREGE
ncbi:MAG TPA: amidohydrolase family protein, partial [Clostridia bacterium]|nr:amidohydrolase family protein [Clostridia bacterium]